MKGGGTDAPEDDAEEEEETRPSVSYDDMWAKTLLDGSDSSVSLILLWPCFFTPPVSQSCTFVDFSWYRSHLLLMRVCMCATG